MAISLGFHLLFAVVGIALPFMMAVGEAFWLKTRDPVYLLARSEAPQVFYYLFRVFKGHTSRCARCPRTSRDDQLLDPRGTRG